MISLLTYLFSSSADNFSFADVLSLLAAALFLGASLRDFGAYLSGVIRTLVPIFVIYHMDWARMRTSKVV